MYRKKIKIKIKAEAFLLRFSHQHSQIPTLSSPSPSSSSLTSPNPSNPPNHTHKLLSPFVNVLIPINVSTNSLINFIGACEG
jgi:hypothetical protein